jgi:hypothetical protein
LGSLESSRLNFDWLIEIASQGCRVITHANTAGLASWLREPVPAVIKVHGCVDDIETVVLGSSQYRRLQFVLIKA